MRLLTSFAILICLFQTSFMSGQNDKSVLPEGRIPLSALLDTFDYTIRFQNTGTDTANQVIIVDELPALLDPLSVRIKTSSHFHFLKTENNKLIFTFTRIFLPASAVNERNSHGFIRFTVSPKMRLSVGETVNNQAQIFFDLTPAINTNIVQNTVYKPTVQSQKTVQICEGTLWKGVAYTRSTLVIDTIKGALIDTVNLTFLDVKPKYNRQIDTTVRFGDTLFGQRIEVDQRFVFERRTTFGCDSITVYKVVVVKPSKTLDLDGLNINISVAPNPTSDWLSINYTLKKYAETEIYCINALGQKTRLVKQKSQDTEGEHTVHLDTRGFAVGFYQIILQTPVGRAAIRFSKI
jgi:hypothetical protein